MTPITAKELTKAYRLYSTPYNRLKELILRRPFHTEFIALSGISFSVHQGETLGIIGENGAGKSTLLKILSKTLSPTSGQFEMQGTVSSLLELGSGFHPEFTGLENIYFYGSLLGMDKKFMETKVHEIIAFSELGDFIHYPIKTYSSGMFVRLAFSVATAVDPDLLIIDEILSVGDLHFQKKSTDRILSFREKGKTIVFCSHEMYHIARLCNRILWLKNGKVHMEGDPLEVIQAYETYQLSKSSAAPSDNPPEQEGTAHPTAEKAPDGSKREQHVIYITKLETIPSATAKQGEDLRIRIQITVDNDTIPYRVAVKVRTVDGLDIIGIGTKDMDPFYGKRTITLRFPSLQLRSGTFIIEAYAFDAEGVYWYDRKEAVPLTIPRESLEYGIVDLPHEWIID